MFKVEDLKFSYGKKEILKGISFEINSSDIVSILGPNGCGKTTLLKIMLGFLKPSQGKVYFGGKDISKIKPKHFFQRVAYIPQIHDGAFGYLVKDVVLMGRMPYKSIFSNFNKEDKKITLNALEVMGIEHLKDEIYTTLSGGQRQLVLIARAIAQQADIFIMDEPVNGLDFGNQYKLLNKIKELSKKDLTFIKTSHYPDHVFFVSNEAIFLDKGKILEKGNPETIIREENIKKVYKIESKIININNRNICLAV
ncbi:ABC transporter ATP-binding protein [Halarcobacter anaerophilus]|jgi:iron complex transport system ATP-binding protein|uniref:ABC transporter ATP-binding protein n=1 Tax=Halarcobacter anaerophilus TaxID=877500 RepID=A0A4Q0XY95_9BACT|nr:ABC transporter ATP-binding protein [Halarcobacter anaerophilus]QDF29737.1 iron siderophore ABC transporter, ATP-binding protein [Halarcobacter anaerophilus]RXJ62660.1 ABC transporter ATP-binding protein [Halarcobacter anaerophilus]